MAIPNGVAVISVSYDVQSGLGSVPTTVWAVKDRGGDPDTAATAFFTEWEQNIVPGQTTDVHATYHVETPTASYDLQGEADGAGGSEAVEPNTALLVAKFTGLKGRANRGRCYLPWALQDTQVNQGGTIAATPLNAWIDRFNDFQSGLDIAQVDVVIYHADTSTSTIVTALQVRSTVATQRRRLRK